MQPYLELPRGDWEIARKATVRMKITAAKLHNCFTDALTAEAAASHFRPAPE